MPVVHSPAAGWSFHPAGYDVETPKTADVKLPVNAASCEGCGLATTDPFDDGDVDGDDGAGADGEDDGVAAAPGPVDEGRKGPATAKTMTAATTAAAAIPARAVVLMCWNLRGTRMSTRRCRVVSMEESAA
jgi:hypothetical protein